MNLSFRFYAFVLTLATLSGCASQGKPPPSISLVEPVQSQPLPEPPKPVEVVSRRASCRPCSSLAHRAMGYPQHPADADRASGPPDAHHRQPRLGAAAVPAVVLQSGDFTMSTTRKLGLGPLPKTESDKLTFACPVALKADLDRYAALHGRTYDEEVDAATRIPICLRRSWPAIGDSSRAGRVH